MTTRAVPPNPGIESACPEIRILGVGICCCGPRSDPSFTIDRGGRFSWDAQGLAFRYIELRKKNSDLKEEIQRMGRQHEADAASIAALEKRTTTAPVLANDRVDQLFTVHGIEFGRLTGIDPDMPTSRFKVYVTPVDETGDVLKAAGAGFVVDVFDLSCEE